MTRKIDCEERFVAVSDKYKNSPKEVRDHNRFLPNARARLATEMAVKWGMVAGEPDGEDTKGRAKQKLMAAKDVVARSIEVADLIMTEIESRGWMDQMPTFEDIYGDE